MYIQSTALSRELGTKTEPISKRKPVCPGECEISPVSIYGEVYGANDLRKRVLSLEWKREGVIDGYRGGDDSVDPTYVGYWEGERPDISETVQDTVSGTISH